MKAGLAAAAALLAASWAVASLGPPTALPPLESLPIPEYAVQDAGMALAGLRRVGGDAAFIEMLQYLAGSDGVDAGHDHDHEHGEGTGDSHSGWLPKTYPLSLRIAVVSPYFHGAHLFTAGALGFVLDRPAEAFALLERVSRLDPSFWRYRLYMGAIGYQREESPDKVIKSLEEALKYPDCPSILQNILANLHKKKGNFGRAAEIYAFTAATSRDPGEAASALRQLERLRAEGKVP